MRNFISIVFLLVFTSSFIPQTAKYAVLDEKDPLIGQWEWVKDPTGSPYQPFPDLDWIYISFSPGSKVSLGALSYDETKGFGCPCYFLAYNNGSSITGMLTDCCIATDKGKKLSFNYNYDVAADQLVITVKGEQIIYKRKQ